MALPFFYIDNYDAGKKEIQLNEETSKHVVQVLRMKPGEQLNLTDGKGNLLTCAITNDNKKHCIVEVRTTRHQPSSRAKRRTATRKVSIAISLLKNTNRFEWFLEKATELGVHEIIPLVCERTEKEKFRRDRLTGICTSAMLQSQQVWLPVLHEPVKYENMQMWKCENGINLIAHCGEEQKQSLADFQISTFSNSLICIGPEGDFTPAEIELALRNDFIPVTLGETRLRTETAGVVAATLLQLAP